MRYPTIDLTGERYGLLVVQSEHHRRVIRQNTPSEPRNRTLRYWLCQCDCGDTSVVEQHELKQKKGTRSCGCLSTRKGRVYSVQHGHGGKNRSREYLAWCGMLRRCRDTLTPEYSGRGISVCKLWESFPHFLADMGECPSLEHSLDRIDVNGNYEPGNCRWGTPEEQANNRRSNRYLTLDGTTLSIAQWSRKTGIKSETIRGRIARGWTSERILSPVDQRRSARGPRVLTSLAVCPWCHQTISGSPTPHAGEQPS